MSEKPRWDWMVVALVLGIAFSGAARARGFEIGDLVEPSLGMSSGSWADSVPIETTPAPGGAAPRLALSVDHRASEGPLGSGWILSGTSIITRHSVSGGVPNYSVGDSYRLDGQPLTWVASPSPAHWEAETWDGGRLDYAATSNTWTRKKDGWTWTYGSKAGTGIFSTQLLSGPNGRSQQQIPAPNEIMIWHTPAGSFCTIGANMLCNTASWRLSLVTDPFGNTITYDYTVPTLPSGLQGGYWFENSRNPLLSEVRFAQDNGKVKFVYVDRPDQRIRVDSGTPSFLIKRLSAIESWGKANEKGSRVLLARYELEYNDQDGIKCDGSHARSITRPRASILRRITRTGVAGAPPRHVVRCLETNTELPEWEDNAAATVLSGLVVAPFGSFDPSSDSVIPLSLHLNRDGVTDLLLLGLRKGSATAHRAYIGTPAAANPFADSSGGTTDAIAAAEWQSLANEAIDDSLLEDKRGWGVADLDKDGVSELIVEKANAVKRRWFDTVGGARHIETLNLAGCDLRYGSFADIDGDGSIDLVRRAHDESEDGACPAQTTTVWFRNSGSAPWLDSAFPMTFHAPLESATLPAKWRALISAGGACASGVVPPADAGQTTAEGFVAGHAQLADLNGDGVADLTYSLYACWYLNANGDWMPTDGSDFSRTFWGDSYGQFVDSGQAAGQPTTTYGNDVGSGKGVTKTHMFAAYFAPSDFDHDGTPELLSTRVPDDDGAPVMGSFFRGIDEGFGQFAAGEVWDGRYLDVTQDFLVRGLDYVGQAWSCYRDTVVPALGDYNGDGFEDILTFENHDSGATATCPQGSWCVVYRKNTRAASFGRITRSYNAWGGATDLQWGSSALGDNKNPDLPAVMEVLTAVSGPEGRVELSYSGAALSGGAPTSFTTVERLNARGGLDQFEFAVTDALAGRPVYAARRRTDGTLEHVTVYFHGRTGNVLGAGLGYQVDVVAPYYNPPIRQCDFELSYAAFGGQSTTIDELIDDCFKWGGFSGGLSHEFGVLTGHTTAIPMDDPRAVYLKDLVWKHNTPSAEQGEDPRDADAVAMMSRGANFAAARTWDPGPTDNTDPIAPVDEWPLPSGVSPPSVIQPGRGYEYPQAVNNARRFYITDWSFDSTNHKMTRVTQRRDTSTTADDLVETPIWEQPDKRETSITVDPNGTAPTRTWTLAYDDDYAHPDDTLYQEPRSSILRSDGQLEMSYRDGFGRLTKRTTCSGGGGVGQFSNCILGSLRIDEWSLFGGDGLLQLSIAPHAPGESLALTQYGHDGYGRVISVQSPANISAGGAFRTTFTYYKLGAIDTVAPDSQISTVSYSTLSEATTVAGVPRGSRTLDPLGHTTSWVGPDGVRLDYTHDGFGRVTQIAPTTDISYIDSLGVARMGHPVRTFTYDLGGRVLHETAGDGHRDRSHL